MFHQSLPHIVIIHLGGIGVHLSSCLLGKLADRSGFVYLPMFAAPDEPLAPGMAKPDFLFVLCGESLSVSKVGEGELAW